MDDAYCRWKSGVVAGNAGRGGDGGDIMTEDEDITGTKPDIQGGDEEADGNISAEAMVVAASPSGIDGCGWGLRCWKMKADDGGKA